jgi:outer membrane protein OmpA-like peptidoglycan-associated protein/tetratricopeptide (TPR) repeat protein
MKKIASIIFLLISVSAFAQRVATDYGDIYFEFFQFKEAARYYEEALATGKSKKEQYLYEQLSQCYKYLFQYEKAEEYFEKLMETKNVKPEYYIDYGQVLKLNGKYAEAKKQFEKFQDVTKTDIAEPELRSVQWAIRNADTIKNYAVFQTDLKITGQALGYCYYDDGLIYSHGRNKVLGKSGIPLFDLDYAKKITNTEFERSRDMEIMALIDFDLNEGSPSVSSDKQTLYFAANSSRVKNGKTKRMGSVEVSDDGVSNFKIYAARMEDGLFRNPVPMPFNDNNYSCIHPCISEDGRNLFFSSNMPGGFGGFDLYRVGLQENGKWGDPVNLGKTVNTEENEIFPWVSRGLLYFSSKGFNNYGGYDIFVAMLSNVMVPHTLKNIGKPVNSFRDDVAFMTRDEGRTGYFSSNRGNDEGLDYVYYFNETQLPETILAQAQKTDSALAARNAAIAANSTPKPAAPDGKSIPKQPAAPVRTPGQNGLKATSAAELDALTNRKFTPVMFGFDNAGISPGLMQAADSVALILAANPELSAYVEAHTDSRGSFAYNMGLSGRRAASVKRYLVSKGVPGSRIITKGLGESRLLNECSDNTTCSEEMHSINRRVNMRLVK